MVKTKLCLVGAGSIGRRHLRLLSEREDVQLAVVEPNAQCQAAALDILPGVPFFASIEEAVSRAMNTLDGAYSLVLMSPRS